MDEAEHPTHGYVLPDAVTVEQFAHLLNLPVDAVDEFGAVLSTDAELFCPRGEDASFGGSSRFVVNGPVEEGVHAAVFEVVPGLVEFEWRSPA